MKIGTFLWGIVIAVCGAVAIIRGTSTQLDPSTLVIALLLVFAAACTVAAFVPTRRQEKEPEMYAQTAPASHSPTMSPSQTERFEVEPSAEPSHEA
ncbi:hypothetical protein [Arcanobacterium buesumense]|uniref:Uncharacterized protein n=1 Tax=Arcanobacterium buesumense TaxID=2722751 RepID=A0A6H2EMD2_9ACTO|nr:hypothetical protein [Arcanobacterium buesumense]QJC22212.1 hypothetical protein HC352_06615 [Arcanobacterium buesumense]